MVLSNRNLVLNLILVIGFSFLQSCSNGRLQLDQASTASVSSSDDVTALDDDSSIEGDSAELKFNGQLTAFDDDGQVNGQITVSHQAIADTSHVKVKFFSFYQGEKTYIGSYNIDIDHLLGGQNTCHAACSCSCNDNSITFPFIFLVPPEYRCHTILAFLVDPISGDLVQIPAPTSFLHKKKKHCEDGVDPVPPTDPEPEVKPMVEIDHLYTSGRIVEIAGTCQEGAGDLTFSGHLKTKTSLESTCNNGSFLHCAIAKKPFQENTVKVTQTNDAGDSADDTGMFLLNHPPIVNLSIESIEIYDNGNKAKVTGECTTGAKVTLNIYNNDIATFTCEEGYYQYEDIELVNVSSRYLYVTQVTSFGTTTRIWGDVDGKDTEIDCSIDTLTSNQLVCKNSAGSIEGSCHPGLPVKITVDNKLQEIAYCDSSGQFSADNILLSNLGMDNKIKIKQVSPFAKTCSDTVTIQQFQ